MSCLPVLAEQGQASDAKHDGSSTYAQYRSVGLQLLQASGQELLHLPAQSTVYCCLLVALSGAPRQHGSWHSSRQTCCGQPGPSGKMQRPCSA